MHQSDGRGLVNCGMPESSDTLEALYSQDEELNPLGHEIISRKLDPSELSIPDNLNWSSKADT